MADNNATILIPDISGFTEFMTTTELGHASHAINILIESMLQAVGEEYQVSEIEGDAVLLIKKGPAPSQKAIFDTCLKIFNAFHFQRKWLQQHTICPCGACQSIINLTLKFIVHHGPLAEIKIGGFVKQAGPEMIVAHRLLKNSIDNNEYLLVTEKLLQQMEPTDLIEVEWLSSSEEYSSIGKIDYRFTLLNEAKKNVPDPPPLENNYTVNDSTHFEIQINTPFMDVYTAIMNIPGRPDWVPGLQKVEQDRPEVYIGSVHRFTFDNYSAIVSPLRMVISDEGILYAETFIMPDRNLSLIYEFVFKKIDENSSSFTGRFLNPNEAAISEETKSTLFNTMKEMAQSLKIYCEKQTQNTLKEAFLHNNTN